MVSANHSRLHVQPGFVAGEGLTPCRTMPAYGARDTAAAAGVPATSYQGAEDDNVPATLRMISSTRRVFSAVALSAVALAGAAFASGRVSGGASGVSLLDAYSHSDAVPPPGVTTNEHALFVSNELERNNGFRIGQGYLPWVHLVPGRGVHAHPDAGRGAQGGELHAAYYTAHDSNNQTHAPRSTLNATCRTTPPHLLTAHTHATPTRRM